MTSTSTEAPHPPVTAVGRFTERPSEGASKTLRAAGWWAGPQRAEVTVRGFSYGVDQPVRSGGRDTAPTPMEFVAGAVDACAVMVIEQSARRRGVPLTAVSAYSLARQDTRGMSRTADVQPYFHTYRLELCVATPQDDPAALRSLAVDVEHSCPALNLLRDAAIDLTVAWTFTRTLEPHHAEARCNAALGYESRLTDETLPTPTFTLIDADVPGVHA